MRIPWGRESEWRDQRGAALVELSFAIVLLLVVVFGIITFGLILSFKQGMTQAASDGARAAAVAPVGDAQAVAAVATARSVEAFDQKCNVAGLICTFGPPRPCAPSAAARKCMEVELIYDYKNFPLIPRLPLLAALLPDKLTSTSDVEVNS
jgi:hypothetical protein